MQKGFQPFPKENARSKLLNECMQVCLYWRTLADLVMGGAEGDTGLFTSLCWRRQYQK